MKFSLLTCLFLVSVQFAFAQQKIPQKKVVKPLPEIKVRGVQQLIPKYSFSSDQFFNFIRHSSSQDDKLNANKFAYLKDRLPNLQNIDNYFALACAYWNLNQLQDAEFLFKKIYDSANIFNITARYNSDVKGDTSTNLYGYGSYSYNILNDVCIYLCMINIENEKFEQANKYLNDAKKKYKTSYSCGTGANLQQDKYDFLTGLCFEGMGEYQKALNLLAPKALVRNDDISIRIIKKLYAPTEIQKELERAMDAITFKAYDHQSYSYTTTYSTDKNTSVNDTNFYYISNAKITFLNVEYEVPSIQISDPTMDNKFIHIAKFKQTYFYRKLVD
jgi:hypothetical protein